MTISRAERLRTAERAQAEGTIREDTSEVVHTFADGWMIVRLTTCGDVRREGFLMSSCVPKYLGDALIEKSKPARYQPCERGDEDPVKPVDHQLLVKTDLSGCNYQQSLHSLRDPMNLPHLTWWSSNRGAWDIFGHKNCKPKAKYLKRLGEWAEAAEIRCVEGFTEHSATHKLYEDGLHTYEGFHLNRRYFRLSDSVLGREWSAATTKQDPAQASLVHYQRQMFDIMWSDTLMIGVMHQLSSQNKADREWLKWKGDDATAAERTIGIRNCKTRRRGICMRKVKLQRAHAQMQSLTDAMRTPLQRQWHAGRRGRGGSIMTQSNERLRDLRRKGRRR